jgi:hypothetical protein
MRVPSAITLTMGVAVIGMVAAALIWSSSARTPPALSFVRMEPAGILDENGEEMRLLTLKIANLDKRPPLAENLLNVRNAEQGIEAKISNHWVHVEGVLRCVLFPGESCERLFLMPARAKGCRVTLKHTGTHLSGGELWRMAQALPQRVRFQAGTAFWRRMGSYGMPQYVPKSRWRKATEELAFPSP